MIFDQLRLTGGSSLQRRYQGNRINADAAMQIDWSLFNQGWVGIFIGLIGIAIAIYTIARRTGGRLAYQYFGQRLLEGSGGLLPNEVVVQYAGTTVPRVSLSQVIIWNAGRAPVRGVDIVATDPIKFLFEDGAEILKVEIAKCTRDANESTVALQQDRRAFCYQFSFLDCQDGALIKVLHTGAKTRPRCLGTIVGLPKGIEQFGRVGPLPITRQLRNLRSTASTPEERSGALLAALLRSPIFSLIIAVLGIGLAFFAVFADVLGPTGDNAPTVASRIAFGIMGALYGMSGLFVLWLARRRYPAALTPDEFTSDRDGRKEP